MSKEVRVHVAIIPDGNRRWAKARGLLPHMGHEKGSETFINVMERAAELKIEWLTIWGASVANLEHRSKTEVEILKKIFARGFQRAYETKNAARKKGIRVCVVGEWKHYFDEATGHTIENLMRETETNQALNLTILIAYDGDKDMLHAINAITAATKRPTPITHAHVKKHLATRNLPDVDLLIRTGGEPHLSNGFMMWETRNAQLAFPSCWWPDFTADLFQETVEEYQTRGRRFGK